LPAQLEITIRPAQSEDWPAIVDINDSAFGGPAESALIAALERSGRATISLVAISESVPVGHIFFSPLRIHSSGPTIPAIALAPMAVLPRCQRRGVGSRLVEAGLKACADQAYQVVVVVGDPRFYRRFGFTPAGAAGLVSIYSEAGDAFMVTELTPGALEGRTGTVEYPSEFADV